MAPAPQWLTNDFFKDIIKRAIDHEISISDDEIIAYISKKRNNQIKSKTWITYVELKITEEPELKEIVRKHMETLLGVTDDEVKKLKEHNFEILLTVPGAGAVGKRPYPRGRGSTAPRAARGRRQDRRRGGAATALAGGRTVPRGAGLGGSSGAARRWPRGSPQLAAPRGSRGPRARRGAPGPGRLRRPAAACDFLRAFLGHYPESSDARRRRRGDVARSGPPAR